MVNTTFGLKIRQQKNSSFYDQKGILSFDKIAHIYKLLMQAIPNKKNLLDGSTIEKNKSLSLKKSGQR